MDTPARIAQDWLGRFETALRTARRRWIARAVSSRLPLARSAGIRVGHPHRKRRGSRGFQPAAARREHASAWIQDRPATHAATAGDARGRTMHRSHLRFRVRGGTGRRRGAPFPGHAESLDAADRALRARGARRAGGPAAAEGPGVLARFFRAELAGPAQSQQRIPGPGSGGARRRRRPRGPFDCRAPHAARDRRAGRRPRRARWRQLAQALSRAHAAQPGVRQSPAVHAVPAQLAGLHPERQARQLVRVVRRGDGAQLLDRDRVPGRHLRREGRTLDRDAAARRRQPAHLAATARGARHRRERHPERSGDSGARRLSRQSHPFRPVRRRRGLARQARGRHRHRQQRPRHRAGSVLGGRAGHARAAQPDARHPVRPERAARVLALQRRAAARGLRPHYHLGAAGAGEAHAPARHRAREGPGSRAARCARAQGLSPRLRRGRHRLAIQVPHARRRLLLQRRLLGSHRRRARSASRSTASSRPCCPAPTSWSWRRAGRARKRSWPGFSARGSRRGSARSGDSARTRSCATCSAAPRSRACGSSPAASRSAGSTRAISRYRSRRISSSRYRAAIDRHHPIDQPLGMLQIRLRQDHRHPRVLEPAHDFRQALRERRRDALERFVEE